MIRTHEGKEHSILVGREGGGPRLHGEREGLKGRLRDWGEGVKNPRGYYGKEAYDHVQKEEKQRGCRRLLL